jgi:hypothetical protein
MQMLTQFNQSIFPVLISSISSLDLFSTALKSLNTLAAPHIAVAGTSLPQSIKVLWGLDTRAKRILPREVEFTWLIIPSIKKNFPIFRQKVACSVW